MPTGGGEGGWGMKQTKPRCGVCGAGYPVGVCEKCQTPACPDCYWSMDNGVYACARCRNKVAKEIIMREMGGLPSA